MAHLDRSQTPYSKPVVLTRQTVDIFKTAALSSDTGNLAGRLLGNGSRVYRVYCTLISQRVAPATSGLLQSIQRRIHATASSTYATKYMHDSSLSPCSGTVTRI